MNPDENFEELKRIKPGDQVLRVRRRTKRPKIRYARHLPNVLVFLKDMFTTTALPVLIVLLLALGLLAAYGMFAFERGAEGQITSYTDALWWCFTAMQTQGANSPGPVTAGGTAIGVVWSVFSTVVFFGIIIGTLYAYFMTPRRRPTREMVGVIEQNLERFESLPNEELEVLRDLTVRIIDHQIKMNDKAA